MSTCLLCEGGEGERSAIKMLLLQRPRVILRKNYPLHDMEQAAISSVLWEQSMNTVPCQSWHVQQPHKRDEKITSGGGESVRGIVVMSGPLKRRDSLVYGAIPLMWKVCCPRPSSRR